MKGTWMLYQNDECSVDEEVVVEDERRDGDDAIGDDVVETRHRVLPLRDPGELLHRLHLKASWTLSLSGNDVEQSI